MRKKLHIIALGLAMLLLLGGCLESDGQELAGGSWQGLSQCSPSLSVSGNTASCGLFVRGTSYEGRLGANLRLQRLENGAYRTIRLWYGLESQGELDFADKCWLNEAGSYRLSAQVWVDELEPVVLSADLKLENPLPWRPDGEELDYENVALFAFKLPQDLAAVEPEIWQELIATCQTEADRYYNAAPGLLLQAAGEEIVLPLEVLEQLAAALANGELRQLAVELSAGRVCFLDYGQSLCELADNITLNNDFNNESANGAGLGIRLAATAGGGWELSFREAASGRGLRLADDDILKDMLIYGRLEGISLAAWEQSAARTPSERTETPLYADLVVLHEGSPVASGDIVYGINGDSEPAAYVRILSRDCGEYQVAAVREYAGRRWYRDYVTYLAGREVIDPAAFEAERVLSRGELAELLYRLAGEPERYTQVAHRDESTQEPVVWEAEEAGEYARAVGWAANRGIITGFADGSFRSEDKVTKQELLVMLWRYVERAGTKLPHNREDIYYYDRGRIGGFAREAVSAFSEAGLAPREDWRRLAPTKPVTWAEAAKLAALVNQSVLNGLERFVLK